MGRLVFFLGPAGAGKTTVAKSLARRRSAVLLDMDTLLRPAAEAIMKLQGLDPDDRDSDDYKRLCRDLGYRITMDAALENIELGTECFVIGPFTKETEDPKWLKQELRRIGRTLTDIEVKVVFVHLKGLADYRQRIERRGSVLDQWKLDHWETFSRSLARRQLHWPIDARSMMEFDNTAALTSEKLAMLELFLDQQIMEE
ncbi:adenylate kinase family enzyme [Paenibacillus phyllosphaerae]|uniref:Adenylate kinase family enzyme n=1 Tax=Paenibacillus phyllosphaerae TaxID=274593 RepID=A0A7W5B469_9BACL|nr:AAA family ATPase [Paenibacillus phyllosphaerae]MBB3113859.1 adenylate kinase family enzyme [Paenibacillus phyllosphaerae]